MTQILVLVGIIIAMTIGVTMYLDQAAEFAEQESGAMTSPTTGSESDTSAPTSGIGSILDSAHTAADQLQPRVEE